MEDPASKALSLRHALLAQVPFNQLRYRANGLEVIRPELGLGYTDVECSLAKGHGLQNSDRIQEFIFQEHILRTKIGKLPVIKYFLEQEVADESFRGRQLGSHKSSESDL